MTRYNLPFSRATPTARWLSSARSTFRSSRVNDPSNAVAALVMDLRVVAICSFFESIIMSAFSKRSKWAFIAPRRIWLTVELPIPQMISVLEQVSVLSVDFSKVDLSLSIRLTPDGTNPEPGFTRVLPDAERKAEVGSSLHIHSGSGCSLFSSAVA